MARQADPARAEAKARGEKRYVSARALGCPKGHVGERFVISTACCKCADIKRAERIAGKSRKPIKVKVPKPIKPEPIKIIAPIPGMPRIIRAMADYGRTVEAQERSLYLNSLLTRVPHAQE
jgi:hypothetical protein